MKNRFAYIIERMVSVSDLGRGKASGIINRVSEKQEQYIVVKNNKPEAVILSIDEYSDLIDAKEDLELLKTSMERLKTTYSESTFSHDEIINEFGFSKNEIEESEDEADVD